MNHNVWRHNKFPFTTSKMSNNNQKQLLLYNYKEVSKNSADGFSMYFFHVFENRAIVAPSITLWSAVQLTHIIRALIKFSNWSYRGTICKRRRGRQYFKQNFNTLTLTKIKVSMAAEIRGVVFRLRHCVDKRKVWGNCISSNLTTYKDITWILPSAPIATWDGNISGFMYVPPIWKKQKLLLQTVLVCIHFFILYL